MIIAILFITLFIVILIVISLLMGVFGVPYVPTPKVVFQEMQKAGIIKEHAYVLELGAGDARFLRFMHKQYDISGIGYEISPLFFSFGWLAIAIQKLRTQKKEHTIHMAFKSYFSADFSHADVIYCYLLPHTLQKLAPYFATMKKGSLLLSYDFHIATMVPTQTITVKNNKPLYLYIKE